MHDQQCRVVSDGEHLRTLGPRGSRAEGRRAVLERERADQLWRETGEQVNRILRSLDRTALAGEAFVRENQIAETARQAGIVLAGLTSEQVPPAAEAGPELADRTAAVITAYRELAATDQS